MNIQDVKLFVIGISFAVVIFASIIVYIIDHTLKTRQARIRNAKFQAQLEANTLEQESTIYTTLMTERQRKNKGTYEVLGVEFDDSDDVVRTAYRKMASKYHPDKLQSTHVSVKIMLAAKEKMQQINKAYDTICKQRSV